MSNDILPFMPQEHTPAELARQFAIPSPRIVSLLAERGIHPRRNEEGDLKFSDDAIEVLTSIFQKD